ncbi:MAG: Hsp20/alpha crystallin family protein [Desulfurivibrio sp.]|nr:Hsp20/alpha crystallin family protein [Desulfurivibrio sp.]
MFTRFSDIDRLFGTMDVLRRRLDNLYTDYNRPYGAGWPLEEGFLRANLYQSGDTFEMRLEVPGMDKESLDIKIQGNYLEISGTRDQKLPEGYKIHKTERVAGTFSRSFTLPDDVDSARVEATLKDGIIYLTLPKSEAAKPRQISIS